MKSQRTERGKKSFWCINWYVAVNKKC